MLGYRGNVCIPQMLYKNLDRPCEVFGVSRRSVTPARDGCELGYLDSKLW